MREFRSGAEVGWAGAASSFSWNLAKYNAERRLKAPVFTTGASSYWISRFPARERQFPVLDFALSTFAGRACTCRGRSDRALEVGVRTGIPMDGNMLGNIELKPLDVVVERHGVRANRKSTRLNSSHRCISYAVFCLKKKK